MNSRGTAIVNLGIKKNWPTAKRIATMLGGQLPSILSPNLKLLPLIDSYWTGTTMVALEGGRPKGNGLIVDKKNLLAVPKGYVRDYLLRGHGGRGGEKNIAILIDANWIPDPSARNGIHVPAEISDLHVGNFETQYGIGKHPLDSKKIILQENDVNLNIYINHKIAPLTFVTSGGDNIFSHTADNNGEANVAVEVFPVTLAELGIEKLREIEKGLNEATAQVFFAIAKALEQMAKQ